MYYDSKSVAFTMAYIGTPYRRSDEVKRKKQSSAKKAAASLLLVIFVNVVELQHCTKSHCAIVIYLARTDCWQHCSRNIRHDVDAVAGRLMAVIGEARLAGR